MWLYNNLVLSVLHFITTDKTKVDDGKFKNQGQQKKKINNSMMAANMWFAHCEIGDISVNVEHNNHQKLK